MLVSKHQTLHSQGRGAPDGCCFNLHQACCCVGNCCRHGCGWLPPVLLLLHIDSCLLTHLSWLTLPPLDVFNNLAPPCVNDVRRATCITRCKNQNNTEQSRHTRQHQQDQTLPAHSTACHIISTQRCRITRHAAHCCVARLVGATTADTPPPSHLPPTHSLTPSLFNLYSIPPNGKRVSPAAASRGFQGRSRIALNRQWASRVPAAWSTSHFVIWRSTSLIRAPRLATWGNRHTGTHKMSQHKQPGSCRQSGKQRQSSGAAGVAASAQRGRC